MTELARIRDAAAVAAKAQHPTDILAIKSGFRIVAHAGGVQAARHVRFSELELATWNPLVEAIRVVNQVLAKLHQDRV